MKALIAFIIMAVLVTALIEINERIKAKKGANLQAEGNSPDAANAASGETACDAPENEDCSACELMAVCSDSKKQKLPAD